MTESDTPANVGSMAGLGLPPLPQPTCGAAILPGTGIFPDRAAWTAFSHANMRAYATTAVADERERNVQMRQLLAEVADNLVDMPISDEWAAKTAARAIALLGLGPNDLDEGRP